MQRLGSLAVLGLVLVAVTSARASLSLRDHQLPIEGEALDTDTIFARVDSLQAVYDRMSEGERAPLALRLGQLYLATGLSKHKRLAMDFFDEAVRDADDPFDAAQLRAATAHRMRYTGQARKWMEELVVERGDDPRALAMLGRFHFLEGRRQLNEDHLENARRAFVHAVQVDSTFVPAWHGLACTAVALREPTLLRVAAQRWGALSPDDAGPFLLEGVAALRNDDPAAAARAFEEGLQRVDADVAAVFDEGRDFLEARDLAHLAAQAFPRELGRAALIRLGEDPAIGEEIDWSLALRDSTLRARAIDLFWSRTNSRPTQVVNPERLRYWTRLVEADVLFGDPDLDRHGWSTAMGEALVRWGWPHKLYYDPGELAPRPVDYDAHGFNFPPNTELPSSGPVWAWGYGENLTLLFTDPSRNAQWTYTNTSAEHAASLRRQQPLSLPRPPEPSSPFRVAMSRAIFPRGDDEAVLETYIGLRPTEELVLAASTHPEQGAPIDTLGVVQWALYDEAGTRIDYRREPLDDGLRLDALLSGLGWPGEPDLLDPYVIPIGARVRAGNYRIAVEVTGPGGRGHDAVALDVVVPPTEPPSILEMSDLQLASAFDRYDPASGIPLRYVKFAQVVVPAPDLRVPGDAIALGVYFEVRHLGLDASRSTHFDVAYEVFRSNREVRNLTRLRDDFRRDDLELIEPLTASFLEERTGVSSEGLVVKGTRLDLSSLDSGDYVLVVTVRDRISSREVSRAIPFRKRGI